MRNERNENVKYDLHVHSTMSDGTYDYREIIDRASRLGLSGISITDHDSITPDIERVYDYSHHKGVLFIHGIEFSTKTSNVHVLGYGLDLTSGNLQCYLKTERSKRLEALQEMCERASRLHLDVSMEEVIEDNTDEASSLGRPHLARLLQKKGYVKDIYEAFHKWLKKGQPVYVDYQKYEYVEIVRKIREWKGIPILAHLSLVNPELQDRVFQESLENGLAGLEVYYPRFNSQQTGKLLNLVRKHKLAMTGGSDFHGENKPDIELGCSGLTEENFEKVQEYFPVR